MRERKGNIRIDGNKNIQESYATPFRNGNKNLEQLAENLVRKDYNEKFHKEKKKLSTLYG